MEEITKERLEELLPTHTLSLWNELTEAVDSLYDVDRLWNKGFGDWVIEYKYRRGGKTLCTFYAKKNVANLLITYGKAEREKFETIKETSEQKVTVLNGHPTERGFRFVLSGCIIELVTMIPDDIWERENESD